MSTRPKMSESQLQGVVIETAQRFGWMVHHDRPAQNSRGDWRTAISGHPGFPDLVLVRDGQVLFVELKSDSGRLSKTQEQWKIAFDGALEVWRPADWQAGTIVQRLR